MGTIATATRGGTVPVEGNPYWRFRAPRAFWRKFGRAVERGEPELDRSKVIRELIRWYMLETDHLPRRPPAGFDDLHKDDDGPTVDEAPPQKG